MPATLGGIDEEYIFAPRQDNLMTCYCATEALMETQDSVATDSIVRMCAYFDNEEIGSRTQTGADSSLLEMVFRRIAASFAAPGADVESVFQRQVAASFLCSADMAHATHPHIPEVHEARHHVEMGKGVVFKTNPNGKYATTDATAFILRETARRKGVPVQPFVVPNDCPCGSTIGPMSAANLSIRTCDVGSPQLSMHSIREQSGTADTEHYVDFFAAFFEHYADVDDKLKINL